MAGVRSDRFGNPTVLRLAHKQKNRKTGELMEIYKTYLQVGSTVIKVEISNAKVEDRKTGDGALWVKFTKMMQRRGVGGSFGVGGLGQQSGF